MFYNGALSSNGYNGRNWRMSSNSMMSQSSPQPLAHSQQNYFHPPPSLQQRNLRQTRRVATPVDQRRGNKGQCRSNFGVRPNGPTQRTNFPQTNVFTGCGAQFPQTNVAESSKPAYHPGMKDIPVWLKGLRLHKYTRMFQEMTYEEMMTLDDGMLESRQVTKGARKKILQSLDKLRERSQLIRQLDKCIDESGDVRCLIVELRSMLNTPIAMYNPTTDPRPSKYAIDALELNADIVPDEVGFADVGLESLQNLPGHIARLTYRLNQYLFPNGQSLIVQLRLEDEYIVKLLQIYDKIISSDAFTLRQKACVNDCKRTALRYANYTWRMELAARSDPYFAFTPSPSNPSAVARRHSDSKQYGSAHSEEDLTNEHKTIFSAPEESKLSSNGSAAELCEFRERNRSIGGSRSVPTSPPPSTAAPIPKAAAAAVAPIGAELKTDSNGWNRPGQFPAIDHLFEGEWSSGGMGLNCLAQIPTNRPVPTVANISQPFPTEAAKKSKAPNCWYNTDSSSSSLTSYPSHTATPATAGNVSPKRPTAPLNHWEATSSVRSPVSPPTAPAEADPRIYQQIADQLQQKRPVAPQPPKPIGSRLPNYGSLGYKCPDDPLEFVCDEQFIRGPLTAEEKLRFIVENANNAGEIMNYALDVAVNRMGLHQGANNIRRETKSPIWWPSKAAQTPTIPTRSQQSEFDFGFEQQRAAPSIQMPAATRPYDPWASGIVEDTKLPMVNSEFIESMGRLFSAADTQPLTSQQPAYGRTQVDSVFSRFPPMSPPMQTQSGRSSSGNSSGAVSDEDPIVATLLGNYHFNAVH